MFKRKKNRKISNKTITKQNKKEKKENQRDNLKSKITCEKSRLRIKCTAVVLSYSNQNKVSPQTCVYALQSYRQKRYIFYSMSDNWTLAQFQDVKPTRAKLQTTQCGNNKYITYTSRKQLEMPMSSAKNETRFFVSKEKTEYFVTFPIPP